MGFGASLVLIAAGAILKFAIATQQTHGVNLGTVGIILMALGIVGFLVTLALATARRRTDVRYRRDGVSYVDRGPDSTAI